MMKAMTYEWKQLRKKIALSLREENWKHGEMNG